MLGRNGVPGPPRLVESVTTIRGIYTTLHSWIYELQWSLSKVTKKWDPCYPVMESRIILLHVTIHDTAVAREWNTFYGRLKGKLII